MSDAPAWPADAVERRRIEELIPYARNARTHTDEQIAQLAESIRHRGWTVPVLIDEAGVLIAGHGRILAAERLGIADVPVVVARGWTDADKRAYRIADNQLALQAGWDKSLLRLEVGALQAEAYDLHLLGFGQAELDKLLAAAGDASGDGAAGARVGSLAERFLVPPFSVLDARQGWWQDRKRGWLARGIRSEIGRGENLLDFSETVLGYGRGAA